MQCNSAGLLHRNCECKSGKKTYFLWSDAAGAKPRSLKVMVTTASNDHCAGGTHLHMCKPWRAGLLAEIAVARSRYTLSSVLRNQIRSLAYIFTVHMASLGALIGRCWLRVSSHARGEACAVCRLLCVLRSRTGCLI